MRPASPTVPRSRGFCFIGVSLPCRGAVLRARRRASRARSRVGGAVRAYRTKPPRRGGCGATTRQRGRPPRRSFGSTRRPPWTRRSARENPSVWASCSGDFLPVGVPILELLHLLAACFDLDAQPGDLVGDMRRPAVEGRRVLARGVVRSEPAGFRDALSGLEALEALDRLLGVVPCAEGMDLDALELVHLFFREEG